MSSTRAHYGIDAPKLVLRFALGGAAGIALALAVQFSGRLTHFGWIHLLIAPVFCIGCTYLITAGIMFWGSRVGKLRLRNRIIASIDWRGDEQVLDVGCGRGLMLIAAAKHLKTGHATGIDLWQTEDQSGNSRETTLLNCRAENVEGRITLKDGDARKLEFPDNTFDLVLSSWAIHNIYDAHGREQAIREIIRVLKPGGRLFIVDIRHTADYAKVLRSLQMQDVQRQGPNFLFAIPTFRLTAMKPTR